MKSFPKLVLTLAAGILLATDAHAGRWLSRDPIQEGAGFVQRDAIQREPNPYVFVLNDPVNKIDPFGLRTISFYFDAFINGNRGSWLREPGQVPILNANYYFSTDDRDFGQFSVSSRNARVFSVGQIDSSKIGHAQGSGAVMSNDTGDSHRRRLLGVDLWGPIYTKKAGLATNDVLIADTSPCETVIATSVAAAYPFVDVAPNINYGVSFTFTKIGNGKIRVRVAGTRNDFPDYEASVDNVLRYQWQSPSSGPGIWNLGMAWSRFETTFEISE